MELRQNSILRISDEKTMELINLYETEGCLWNTALETYKNRQTRHQAAERIAKKLDIKHFTSRYVLIKFKNLRNSYCQELKKISNSVKARDNPVYTPKVFWFKKMDSFLRPHLQYLHMRGRKSTHGVSVKIEPTETEEIVQFSNPEDVFIEESNYYSDSEEFEEEESSRKRSRNSSTTSKRPRLEETHDGELSRMMKDIACHLHVLTNQNQDCFDSFGKYVSAMLRSMPLDRAMELQPQIVNLLVASTLKSEDKDTIT